MKWLLWFCLTTLATSRYSEIDEQAAKYTGDWENGKRRLYINREGNGRLSLKTDGNFVSDFAARGPSATAPDHHKYGKPTDDLTGVCVLDLAVDKGVLKVIIEGEKSECDKDYGGTYQRKGTK